MKLALTYSFLPFLCLWCGVQPSCVMRKECIEINGFPKPCPYSGPALPIVDGLSAEESAEAIRILETRCPYLLYDEFGNRKPYDDVVTCCDLIQIQKMAHDLILADSVLGRCSTCMRNFVRQICEMNCSPDQARFTDVYNATAPDNTVYVNEIDYRMHEDFMVATHASCAGVLVPQSGLPAINLMCGNAPVCTPEAWFGFTGDTSSNPLTPVQVNFYRWPTEEDSMNAYAAPCNETAEGDIPCSCIDCSATCPAGIEPIAPEVCTVLSIHCAGFSVGLVVFVLSFIVLVVCMRREKTMKQKNKDTKLPEEKKTSCSNINEILFKHNILAKIGVLSANNPFLIIMLSSWVVFAMLFGIFNLNITSNPIELWSAPESRSRAELNYFNSRFGPFYRAAQVFLRYKGLDPFTLNNVTYGPAYRIEALEELVKLEDAILGIGRDNGEVTLEEVCYAPMRAPGEPPQLDLCVSMSATTYLGDDRNDINNNTYLTKIQNCINNYLSFDCIASYGGGSDPELTFGGYDKDILQADTLLINFPISNNLRQEELVPVLDWEQKFIYLLKDYDANWKSDFVEVSFGAERSIEDEINRISTAEAVPIVISYLLMLIYVIFALGNVRSWRTWLIDSKVLVALGTVIVIVLAVACALGVMGYTGITVTLLAINVIPFFMLSVGLDNVFLMVNTLHDIEVNIKEYDDYNENSSFHKKRSFVFKKMMEKAGPSMFISSVTQITCFAIGSLSNFPAVKSFAAFASISLGFLFIFQITTVVAIISLDYKRAAQNRFDVFFCIQKKTLNDRDLLNSEKPYRSVISKLVEPYSKFILKPWVKFTVSVIFVAILCMSVILIPQVEVGLDQEMALPPDSYVYKYLQSVNQLMVLGPPVYFVLKSGLNFTDPLHQNVVCGAQLCFEDSLTTQIFLGSQYSDITYISRSSNSWLDDFFDWASLYEACCKYNTTDGSFCSSTDNSPECAFCVIERSDWNNGVRPGTEAFEKYVPFFLQDAPTDSCNKGGLASYFSNVNYYLDSEGRATVGDTNFMAYHSTLSTSYDYITAVKYGYEISANITAAIQRHTGLNVEVFPYSVFYVYYEQYLTIWSDTLASLGYSLIGAFFFNLIASGFNFVTTFAVMLTAVMVVTNMMGVMYIWSIPLNAVSCVNLIVSIGIAVEFCSHIGYAFATSKCSGEERVTDALKTIAPTIITGITLTNLPVIVLAFSYTEIIEVFFFRMFLSLVILSFLHGMIFFPVLLSYLSNLTSK